MYEMRLGFDGCMAGNAYADVFVQIWDQHQAGRSEQAREIYSKMLLMLNCESYIRGAREYVMKRRGIFKTTLSRRYETMLSPDAAREVEFHFQGLLPYLKIAPKKG